MTIRNTQKKGFTITTQKAEVVLGDTIEINRKDGGSEEPYVITTPGEYDVSEVTVMCDYLGQDNDQSSMSYLIQAENITIGYLPHPPKSISEARLSEYELVQILLIPGENVTIVNQIAAPVVIPIDNAEKLSNELSTDLPELSSTFTIKSQSDLPEETQLIFLG